jgi:peptidoglycan/xylan/chitin deacetylase (PgdA/CDA1 family)
LVERPPSKWTNTLVPFSILMYHALWPGLDDPDRLRQWWAEDPQLKDPGARRYGLDQRAFAVQMESLAKSGGAMPTHWNEMGIPRPPATWITFDDGHQSNVTLALPILRRLGLRAIFFITTDWIGQPGFMNEEQIAQLHDAGMLIGSHGCSHSYFSEMSADGLRKELVGSKARLEAITSAPVEGVSLPGGRNHRSIQRLAKGLGYHHIFTSRIGLARVDGNPTNWPRIPITNLMANEMVARIAQGDADGVVQRMARRARVRAGIQRRLGNRLYDKLRSGWLGRSEGALDQ